MIYLPCYLSEDGFNLRFYLVLYELHEQGISDCGRFNVHLSLVLQAKAYFLPNVK